MRRTPAIACGAASVLLASVVHLPAAFADPPPSLRVVGQDAACPTAAQVATVLERMLPRTKITADTGSPGAAEATVSDQGVRFRVTIAGQERSFDDGAHQCTERARHAAVFVAMVVDPPAIADLPSEPPAAPAPVVPPVDAPRPPPERRPSGWQWDTALGAVMLVAPEGEHRRNAVAQGVAAFARGKRGFHLGLGAGVLHGTLHFDVANADAWWIPIDVAAGFTTRTKVWEIGAEVGPSASILSIAGENLKGARRQLRLEVGGRVSAWSRFWFSKQFGAFLSAEAVVRPFPFVLDIDPRGGVGEMPALWLGVSGGVTVALE
ncbi:MAG TPA: hypothetical protein VK540_26370 [Polyangiaceae bacterium]|nr:hypothetical protein [Polyangiaceae bacterium]